MQDGENWSGITSYTNIILEFSVDATTLNILCVSIRLDKRYAISLPIVH